MAGAMDVSHVCWLTVLNLKTRIKFMKELQTNL